MEPTVRYFALVEEGDDRSHPYNIFREFHERRGHFIQHLDPRNPDRWIDNPELVAYTIRGEPGAEEITEDQARKFVESRGGKFSPPELQP